VAQRQQRRAPGRRRLFVPPERGPAYQEPGGRLRIPLDRGEALSGVYFEEGRSAANHEIRLHPDTRPAWPSPPVGASALPIERIEDIHSSVKSDADGRFRFDELAPGTYLLCSERWVDEPVRHFKVDVRRRVVVEEGRETKADLGKDLGPLHLRGRVAGMESRVSVWANVVLRSTSDGRELFARTYRDWGWKFTFPFLVPGKYAVEVEFYDRSGNRRVALPAIEIAADEEREIAVPEDGS